MWWWLSLMWIFFRWPILFTLMVCVDGKQLKWKPKTIVWKSILKANFFFLFHIQDRFLQKKTFLIFHVISKEREREREEEIFCRRRKIGNLSVLEFSFWFSWAIKTRNEIFTQNKISRCFLPTAATSFHANSIRMNESITGRTGLEGWQQSFLDGFVRWYCHIGDEGDF